MSVEWWIFEKRRSLEEGFGIRSPVTPTPLDTARHPHSGRTKDQPPDATSVDFMSANLRKIRRCQLCAWQLVHRTLAPKIETTRCSVPQAFDHRSVFAIAVK